MPLPSERVRACKRAATPEDKAARRPIPTMAGLALLVFSSLMLLISGCRTAPAMPSVDLQHPGWTVHRGQALWQPKTGAPEVAGQLLIASSESGGVLVRFSKDPMEIVLARRNSQGWTLDIPAFDKSFSGRGRPPRRVGWFQFADAVFHGIPGPGWQWSGIENGRWELTHKKTGERLEGYFRE